MKGKPCIELIINMLILLSAPFIMIWFVDKIRPGMDWAFNIFLMISFALIIDIGSVLRDKTSVSSVISKSFRDKFAWLIGWGSFLFFLGIAWMYSWPIFYKILLIIFGACTCLIILRILGSKYFRKKLFSN